MEAGNRVSAGSVFCDGSFKDGLGGIGVMAEGAAEAVTEGIGEMADNNVTEVEAAKFTRLVAERVYHVPCGIFTDSACVIFIDSVFVMPGIDKEDSDLASC